MNLNNTYQSLSNIGEALNIYYLTSTPKKEILIVQLINDLLSSLFNYNNTKENVTKQLKKEIKYSETQQEILDSLKLLIKEMEPYDNLKIQHYLAFFIDRQRELLKYFSSEDYDMAFNSLILLFKKLPLLDRCIRRLQEEQEFLLQESQKPLKKEYNEVII